MSLLGVLSVLSYTRFDEHQHQHFVTTANEACTARLGHAVGGDFMSCVVDELMAVQEAAKQQGSDEYFPVVRHSVDPWAPLEHGSNANQNSELLKDMMRNHSCDVEDGGSQPVRSMTWEYQPPDPCGSVDEAAPPPPPFVYKGGFLPAGNDLAALSGTYTEEEAQAVCLSDSDCAGFTFNADIVCNPERERKLCGEGRHTVYFKSKADGISAAGDWHTFKRRSKTIDCRKGKRKPPPMKLRLRVDVLRESPPVYIVHDFATEKECDYMMNLTIPHMEPSVVYGGNQAGAASSYRQSYSVNMFPDCTRPP